MLDTTDKNEHSSVHTALEPSQIPLPASEPKQSLFEDNAPEEMDFEQDLRSSTPEPTQMHEPQTPVHREIRTVTTTIPMMFSPFPAGLQHQPTTPMTVGHPPLSHAPGSPFPNSAFKPDGTLDREAALAQIRERRGRARSVAIGQATPRKQMLEGVNGRRDISAPALNAWNKS